LLKLRKTHQPESEILFHERLSRRAAGAAKTENQAKSQRVGE
jgi:hypothetical protein